MEIKIKKMGISDIFKLSQLHNDSDKFDYPLIPGKVKYSFGRKMSEAVNLFLSMTPLKALALKYYSGFLAFDQGKPVGVLFFIFKSEDGKEPELGMFVSDDYRGKGIGKLLMETALEWAKSSGIIKIRLAVNENNEAAKHIYEKYGFLPCGKTIRMELNLMREAK